MKREYVMRGRRVEIEEMDGVAAVELAARAGSDQVAARGLGRSAPRPDGDAARTDWSAFQDAGWRFVHPSNEIARALDTRRAPPGVEAVQHVYLDAHGRVLLGTDRLSVRLAPTLTEQAAEAAIEAAGLHIILQLRFAPNLYEVRVGPARGQLDM